MKILLNILMFQIIVSLSFFSSSINQINKSLNKSFLKEEIGKIILEDYLSDKRTNKENKKNIISFHEKLS